MNNVIIALLQTYAICAVLTFLFTVIVESEISIKMKIFMSSIWPVFWIVYSNERSNNV